MIITTRSRGVAQTVTEFHRQITEKAIFENWQKLHKVNGQGVHVNNIADLELDCVQRRITTDPVYSIGNLKKTEDSLFFDGANGFGDNLFQRVVIRYMLRYFKTIYLHTPCHDMYWDMPPGIKFVAEGHKWLRTQAKSASRTPKYLTAKLPMNIARKTYDYCPVRQLKHCSAWIIRKKLGLGSENFDFTFPIKPKWEAQARRLVNDLKIGSKKLCILRPNTLRSEWNYPSRNPKNEHFQRIIDRYKDEYYFLSLADTVHLVEWMDGELRGVDRCFHGGEIPLPVVFGLIKISDLVLCGPAFFMLAGIAIRARTFAVWGGCSEPSASLDPCMGLNTLGYVAPDPSCNCFLPNHDCNREIPERELYRAFEELKGREL